MSNLSHAGTSLQEVPLPHWAGRLVLAGCAPTGKKRFGTFGRFGKAPAHGLAANGKAATFVEVVTEGDAIARINLVKSRESYGVGTGGDGRFEELRQSNAQRGHGDGCPRLPAWRSCRLSPMPSMRPV